MENKALGRLREAMKRERVDVCLIPLTDPHFSEYVPGHYQAARFFSRFTGSNATLVVTGQEAGLWTDGRYFVQAEREIAGSGFTLFRMGQPGVPTVHAYIEEKLEKGWSLGFDGSLISIEERDALLACAKKKGAKLDSGFQPLSEQIWEDRPGLLMPDVWQLEKQYSGEDVRSKLARLREKMEELGVDTHIISDLTEIAWLLNFRGGEMEHVPVFRSYLVVQMNRAVLYAERACFRKEQIFHLRKRGVVLRQYQAIFRELPLYRMRRVLLDPKKTNCRIAARLPLLAKAVRGMDPAEQMKAVRNATEIRHTKEAHIRDGAAVTKFIYELKKRAASGEIEDMTEYTAAQLLADFRREDTESFIGESFDTISAYGSNAAMMHYEATPEQCAPLEDHGFLLVDSGGHYRLGTTDITRTIALGELSDEEKEAFTLVLKGHLQILGAKFLKGCCGANLDILARRPLWERGLDYRCGTGHGVGHILSVHEGPNVLRWSIRDRERDLLPLEEGMILSDEPGLYTEGKFGIRIESELLVVFDEKTEYGQFLRFENLTMAPIERDAILPELLSEEERDALNAYHKKVYETLADRLDLEEAAWLREVTAPI